MKSQYRIAILYPETQTFTDAIASYQEAFQGFMLVKRYAKDEIRKIELQRRTGGEWETIEGHEFKRES